MDSSCKEIVDELYISNNLFGIRSLRGWVSPGAWWIVLRITHAYAPMNFTAAMYLKMISCAGKTLDSFISTESKDFLASPVVTTAIIPFMRLGYLSWIFSLPMVGWISFPCSLQASATCVPRGCISVSQVLSSSLQEHFDTRKLAPYFETLNGLHWWMMACTVHSQEIFESKYLSTNSYRTLLAPGESSTVDDSVGFLMLCLGCGKGEKIITTGLGERKGSCEMRISGIPTFEIDRSRLLKIADVIFGVSRNSWIF